MNRACSPLTLFIVKMGHSYGGDRQPSRGLFNSARFVVQMLADNGFQAKLVEAVDGNSIDALVHQNRPSRVVIEAIWVTPKKMAELQRLWPSVRWVVRVHSEIPFLANEGIAIQWLAAYLMQGIEVAFNSAQTVEDFRAIGASTYLPNYYPLQRPRNGKPHSGELNIGCFGAIRPLKNQLIQAFAAVRYAREHKKRLTFHMNGSRIEQSGSSNLKNVISLFAAVGDQIVLHPWLDHLDFLKLVATMDMCLQVSFSESFCICAADAVGLSVPLVGSAAIRWLPPLSVAETGNTNSIVSAMRRAGNVTAIMNRSYLRSFLKTSESAWVKWLH